jgi:hypothetical protein
MGLFGRGYHGRDSWGYVGIWRVRGILIMQKLTFNRAGWIVIAVERTDNWIQHIRFDTKTGARSFLKANPAAWIVG